MIGQLSKIACLVLVIASLITGCRQQYQEGVDVLASSPDIQMLPVPPDYASAAIVATGGLQEWAKTVKIELEGVVALYQPDGSIYLTEQRYQIYPWSNSIQVSALEPQGEFICELSRGNFRILAGAEIISGLPSQVAERDLADAIITITTASVRFLDSSVKFTKASEPVKMQGQWYYPISGDFNSLGPYWYKVVFYQNKDNSLVDMLRFAGVKEKKFLVVRGYDYSSIQKRGVLLPARIEIFATDARGALPQRVAQVSFK